MLCCGVVVLLLCVLCGGLLWFVALCVMRVACCVSCCVCDIVLIFVDDMLCSV